jgi:hypothetical protein
MPVDDAKSFAIRNRSIVLISGGFGALDSVDLG